MDYGKLIKDCRTERGLSRYALAKMASMPAETIAKWEKGKSIPRIDYAERVFAALGMKIEIVVRCKECKWKQGAECVRFAEVRPFPDDFCSRAERRTDE